MCGQDQAQEEESDRGHRGGEVLGGGAGDQQQRQGIRAEVSEGIGDGEEQQGKAGDLEPREEDG